MKNLQKLSEAMEIIVDSVSSSLITITDKKTLPAEFYKHVQSEGGLGLMHFGLRHDRSGRRSLTIDEYFKVNARPVLSRKGFSRVSFSLDRRRIKAYQSALELFAQ